MFQFILKKSTRYSYYCFVHISTCTLRKVCQPPTTRFAPWRGDAPRELLRASALDGDSCVSCSFWGYYTILVHKYTVRRSSCTQGLGASGTSCCWDLGSWIPISEKLCRIFVTVFFASSLLSFFQFSLVHAFNNFKNHETCSTTAAWCGDYIT